MAVRRVVVTLLASLSLASTARAAGINLAWNLCLDEGGAPTKTFACNTNFGFDRMVVSFVLPAAITRVSGVVATLDLGNATGTLPAWWEFVNAGACRQNSLSSFTGPPLGSALCLDWTGGVGTTAFLYTIGTFGPNTATVKAYNTVKASDIANLDADQEYATVTLTLNHAKTVGFLSSCAGCSTPVCLIVSRIDVYTIDDNAPAITLTNPVHAPASNAAFWQGSVGAPNLPGFCSSAAVPVRGSTWGAVKSLYR